MSTHRKRNKTLEKTPIVEIPSGRDEEIDIDTPGPVYDDTQCFIDKETSFKWGEVYQMFNNQTFPQLPEHDPDLDVHRAIKRSKLHKIAARAVVFPCTKVISWIVKHANLENKHIINAKGHPVASFQPSVITACYHLYEG
jgi:hypothetical protein